MPYSGGHYEQRTEDGHMNYWVDDENMPYKDELFMYSPAIMIAKRGNVQTFEQAAAASFGAVAAEENKPIMLEYLKGFDVNPLVVRGTGEPLEKYYTEPEIRTLEIEYVALGIYYEVVAILVAMRRDVKTLDQIEALCAEADQAWVTYFKSRHLCVYCNERPGDTIDHIVARNCGGGDEAENRVDACRSCNSSKNDESIFAFMVRKFSKSQGTAIIERLVARGKKLSTQKRTTEPEQFTSEIPFGSGNLPGHQWLRKVATEYLNGKRHRLLRRS
jgi:5-methylcytosine-specific restriction endonuclease McrA